MITITIGGVDYSAYVLRATLRIEQVLTSQPDNLKMTLIDAPTKPDVTDEIEVADGTDILFAGKVLKVGIRSESQTCFFDIEAKDWTTAIDGDLVVNTYESETVDDIIADILTGKGITLVHCNCPITVDQIKFDYEQPSICLQRLAELVGYDWYIDYTKDLHFYAPTSEAAPFDLTDTSNNYSPDTLQITEDSSQIRNLIFVEGGEYLGDSFTEETVADGDQRTFPVSYKYNSLTVAVDATPITVGVDFLDDEADYDCLYNFQQKVVRFPDATKPTVGQVLTVAGLPYIPVLIRFEESSSMTTYGTRAIRILDKTIKSKEAAKERAKAEIKAYKSAISEGKFQTWTSGLRAGQSLHIQSTMRGIDETYIITKTVTTLESSSLFKYDVTLASKRTYDILSFLQSLMDKRSVSDDSDKVLQKIYNVSEEIKTTATITQATVSTLQDTITITESVRTITPVWVAGVYVPTSSLDYNRTPNADRGAEVLA